MSKISIIITIIGWMAVQSYGQVITLADIPFQALEGSYDLPFAGGLRAPQFSTADLNLDGQLDIVIFEREGKVIIPLVRDAEGVLKYRPEFRNLFPAVDSWMLMRDYNHDGIQDIFASPVTVGLPGVEVYKGVEVDGQLAYELVRFPANDFDILFVPVGSIETQIYASVLDIPDIKDVDGDGDLDILAFEPSGSTVYLYQNQSAELGFATDTLIYTLAQNCYGGVVESGFSQEVSLSPIAGTCASFLWSGDDIIASNRHAGSTVLSIDITGDGLHELLLGDLAYNGLVALINTGTTEEAHFTDQILRFPGDENGAEIELFLSGFYEDIDADGEDELVVSPNDKFSSQSIDHIWTYDVSTSPGAPAQYQLTDKNFLIDDMVYPGPNTAPMFLDYNADGMMDLVIGTGGRSPDGLDVNPKLILYENIGTSNAPAYSLADDDYLDMAAFKTTSRSFAPAIGDLDGDGDRDMIIGDNRGRLYYLENDSDSPDILSFRTPVYEAFDIKVSAWATPFIYDMDGDGLGDLVIGEQNFNNVDGRRGSINYFQNIGNVGTADFDADEGSASNDPIFGRINLKEPGFINNYSAPALFDLGDEILIASGTASGFVYLYSTDESTPSDSFNIMSTQYGGLREGEQAVLSFADLNGDQHLEVAIGTRRGGLAIYHTDIFADISSANNTPGGPTSSIRLSPNPTDGELSLDIDQLSRGARFQIYDNGGRVVVRGPAASTLDVSHLHNGVYILEVRDGQYAYTERFVKIN